MGQLLRDIRFAARNLARTPAFSVIAIATLALGIGVNTAMFNVAHAVLWRPLPFAEPDRLAQIWETNPLKGWANNVVAPANFADWQKRNTVFTGIAGYEGADQKGVATRDVFLTGAGEPQRLKALRVTGNLFNVLGVKAMLGRTFVDEETFAGKSRPVILSHALWQSAFGSDRGIVGKSIALNGRNFDVVGVMPPEFFFPSRGIQVWLALGAQPAMFREMRRAHWMTVIARLKPGVPVEQARAEMTMIAGQLEREYPDTNTKMGVGVGPMRDWMVGETRTSLVVLIGAVGLLLIIVCANVANLQLSRVASRTREMSIRAALGATRARLIQQLLAEGFVLSLTAGALGLGLAYALRAALMKMSPAALPLLSETRIDGWALAFTLGASLCTAILFGVVPAWQSSRAEGLNDRSRASTGRSLAKSALVTAEVALSLMLVAGAGLLVKSLVALESVNPGFNPEQAIAFNLAFPGVRYPDEAKISKAVFEIERRLQTGPQITAAGSTSAIALKGFTWTGDATVEGRGGDDYERELRHKTVTPAYFHAMGTPLVRGRMLSDFDEQPNAAPVAMANEAMARKYFPGADAVGKRVKFGRPADKSPWVTIVGVVADHKQDAMDRPVRPEVYSPVAQDTQSFMTFVMRTNGNPGAAIDHARREVQAFDKDLAITDVTPLRELVRGSVNAERFRTSLLSGFAVVALVLAAIGIYGVLSYLVTQRTREIGIRMALGARRSELLRLVIGQGMTPVLVGVAAGLAGAFVATRAIHSLLFGVTASDPGTYGMTTAILIAVAAAACVIPALRATRVDPMIALRNE